MTDELKASIMKLCTESYERGRRDEIDALIEAVCAVPSEIRLTGSSEVIAFLKTAKEMLPPIVPASVSTPKP